MTLTLTQARTIADAALAAGREQGLDPLTVAVLDPGGHPLVLLREDGSGILRPQIATSKAWGALGMGFGTRELAARAERMPAFVASLSSVSEGRIVPVPGGVLVREVTGTLLGAVGISGATSDEDEACAVSGIRVAGLVPVTGAG
jgi:uncharacterized protein GlcG (DUF336 family)